MRHKSLITLDFNLFRKQSNLFKLPSIQSTERAIQIKNTNEGAIPSSRSQFISQSRILMSPRIAQERRSVQVMSNHTPRPQVNDFHNFFTINTEDEKNNRNNNKEAGNGIIKEKRPKKFFRKCRRVYFSRVVKVKLDNGVEVHETLIDLE